MTTLLSDEEQLDIQGLDNFYRLHKKKITPNFRIENKDPEDDKEEPVIPDGFHIIDPLNNYLAPLYDLKIRTPKT